MAKAKKRRKPPPRKSARPARPVLTKRTGWSPWTWGGLVAGIVVLGLVVILVARRGAERPTTPPEGVETIEVTNKSHVEGTVQYDRNPPAGGDHSGVWQNCGVYEQPVANENVVHALEHGTVWIAYSPNLPRDQIERLQSIAEDHYRGTERHMIVSPVQGMDSPIVLSAWGAQLKVQTADDARISRFVRFYQLRPGQSPEAGARCSGGTGNPVR